jgi:hypothetical protein
VPAGNVDDGPIVLRYCNACVKKCTICNTAFKLELFWPNKESEGFKAWRSSGAPISAMVQFMLPSDFGNTCKTCQPYQVEPPKVELLPPSVVDRADDSASGLQKQFEALFGR